MASSARAAEAAAAADASRGFALLDEGASVVRCVLVRVVVGYDDDACADVAGKRGMHERSGLDSASVEQSGVEQASLLLLQLTVHHVAFDGASTGVLLGDS